MNLPKLLLITFCLFALISNTVAQANPSQVASTILPNPEHETSGLPDFAAIRDVKAKKQAFFRYLLPLIRQSNQTVLNHRARLMAIRKLVQADLPLDTTSIAFLGGISSRYRVTPGNELLNQIDQLLLKVDAVPESLVLAQAANESGWGTSRFARQANNLFGVWCFTPGCGLTPLSRDAGLTHEVARYATVSEGIDAYIHTINTNPAYIDLRAIRATTRADEAVMNGEALAEGLVHYSARGYDYVREIQQLIRVNKLHEFNLPV